MVTVPTAMRELLIQYAITTLLNALKDTDLWAVLKPAMIKLYTIIERVYRDDPSFFQCVADKHAALDQRAAVSNAPAQTT